MDSLHKMKNLLVYISPKKQLNPEHERMLKVQIENSLDYWRLEDIVLFTNFPCEYKGVKAIVEPRMWDYISKTNPKAHRCVKVNAIVHLLKNKILTETTWNHDFDAFQLAPLDVDLKKEMGVVPYGVYPPSILHEINGKKDFKYRINFGNVFFKPSSLDVFKRLLEKIDREQIYDEDGMTLLLEENPELLKRVEIMNQTYNLGIRCLMDNLLLAEKPYKIVHFPPHQERWRSKFRYLLSDKLNHLIDEKFTNLDSPQQNI